MSSRWPGGVINQTAPTFPYSGVWTVEQVAYLRSQGVWPYGPSDPYFYDVSLLLNGDGTNGAQNNTFLDSSTNNFTITRNGNTTQGSFSPYGSLWSNYFPAGGNYSLTTPASSNTSLGAGNFTIEAWAFTTSFGAYYNIIACKWDYPNKEWLLQHTASSINLYLSTDGLSDSAVFTASVTVPLNTWNHIAVTRSGSSLYFFLNGNLISTQSITQTFYAASIVTAIGNFASSGISDTGMRGYVSNFRLVKGTALYTSSFTPSTIPLTAVSGTQLLTCQSNRFLDNSSNNFTVTPTSSNSIQRFSPFNPTAPYSTSVIGGSGYFDGSGDYLSAGSQSAYAFGTGTFTVQAWLYITSRSATSNIAATRASAGDAAGWSWEVNTSGSMTIYANSYIFNSVGSVPLNAWTHVAFTREGTGSNQTKIYINNVLTATSTSSQDFTNTNLGVGSNNDGSQFPFLGYMSGFRMLKGTALTTFDLTNPPTNITNTSLLLSYTNAGIPDLAMMNNLETVGNAQVSTSVKKYGTGSLAFDGTGDYLCNYSQQAINSTNFGTGDFTIEMWIYFGSTSGSQGIIDDADNISTAGTQKWFLYKDSSQNLIFGQHSVGAILTYAWSPSATTWYYVAITRASGTARMFINGTSVASASNSTNFASSGGLQIGVMASISPLNGYIDDLRITNGLARYTTTFTPPTAALPTY